MQVMKMVENFILDLEKKLEEEKSQINYFLNSFD